MSVKCNTMSGGMNSLTPANIVASPNKFSSSDSYVDGHGCPGNYSATPEDYSTEPYVAVGGSVYPTGLFAFCPPHVIPNSVNVCSPTIEAGWPLTSLL